MSTMYITTFYYRLNKKCTTKCYNLEQFHWQAKPMMKPDIVGDGFKFKMAYETPD